MSTYKLTAHAQRDIRNIIEYIADDDVDAAKKVSGVLQTLFKKLGQSPGIGHMRSDVRNPRYRFVSVYSYVIAYYPDTEPVTIARVVHGARDFRKIFRK